MITWFEAAKKNNSNQNLEKMWLFSMESRIMADTGTNFRYLG